MLDVLTSFYSSVVLGPEETLDFPKTRTISREEHYMLARGGLSPLRLLSSPSHMHGIRVCGVSRLLCAVSTDLCCCRVPLFSAVMPLLTFSAVEQLHVSGCV
jgi:hypothetical protein